MWIGPPHFIFEKHLILLNFVSQSFKINKTPLSYDHLKIQFKTFVIICNSVILFRGRCPNTSVNITYQDDTITLHYKLDLLIRKTQVSFHFVFLLLTKLLVRNISLYPLSQRAYKMFSFVMFVLILILCFTREPHKIIRRVADLCVTC